MDAILWNKWLTRLKSVISKKKLPWLNNLENPQKEIVTKPSQNLTLTTHYWQFKAFTKHWNLSKTWKMHGNMKHK
jgi:hypothetical protein